MSCNKEQKRCLYEILGLTPDCSPEEIRSSYRKLALQLHPDKLISTGVAEEVATARFQEILNAYEVLSDARERAWYDSHRSQILFSDPKDSKKSSYFFDSTDLFALFSNSAYVGFSDTGRGFYKVYADAFSKIYAQELDFAKKLGLGLVAVRDAPMMGNLESPYAQVSAFYGYWLGFCTVMDFSWADEYHASGGTNRKARRIMEEENKKARRKAKREFTDTVRGLAEFVKKRDKRVIDFQMKKRLEEEKIRAKEKERKEEEARAKMERARLYQEPEWSQVNEEEIPHDYEDETEGDDKQKKKDNELYCVLCSKKFKSEKQWINHEQSKKHKEKVAELRESFEQEDEEGEVSVDGGGVGRTHSDSGNNVDELFKEFEEKTEINDSDVDVGKINDAGEEGIELEEEKSVLGAMLSGHKSRKNGFETQPEPSSSNVCMDDGDETSFMEYDDNMKKSRRCRRSKKEGRAKFEEEAARTDANVLHEERVANGSEIQDDKGDGKDMQNLPESDGIRNGRSAKSKKPTNQSVDGNGAGQKDSKVKLKKSSKGKKHKETSKTSGLACETCGENFETRNKLFIHLGDTGHAMLKLR